MDKDLWQRVDELFEQALERPADQRRDFLDRLSLAAELRAAIDRLLEADTLAKSFLEARTAMFAATGIKDEGVETAGELPGRLGPYKVLGLLGSGGMGQVYLAARADDQFQRLVAIKAIRTQLLGVHRGEVLARFQLERQALAQLEHPNIARLYDAGQDEEGNPFLVLEHVEGVPVDVYCDYHRLDIEARLLLFRQVCEAVQFAHRNLVVHRDLKPSNILVKQDGRPILLDFGIAKLLDSGGQSLPSGETRTGSRPMTPGYASPEQVKGLPITTSSDVYSLGVLLYELLTGRKPYRLTSNWQHDLEKAICEEEPERPSTAVLRAEQEGTAPRPGPPTTEMAERRATTPQGLARQLRGDLDTLLATALRKEPVDRYPSVEALSEDIQRYLQLLPLAARPPQLADRLGKFWRRHRLGVALAAIFFGLIVTFVALLFEQGQRIRRERDKAEQALAFLVEVFRASDPTTARGGQLNAREILDAAAGRIEKELQGQPDVQATLMDAMGQVYLNLRLLPPAERLLAEALARRQSADPRELAATHLNLCELALAQGRYPQGESLCHQSLLRLGAEPSLARTRALDQLASLVENQGRTREAVELRRQALATIRVAAPGSGLDVDRMSALASSLILDRQWDAADATIAEVLKQSWRADTEASVTAAGGLQKLGDALLRIGEAEQAEAVLRRAVAIQEKLLDPAHPALLSSLRGIAEALAAVGKHEGALELQQRVYQQRLQRLGPDHPDVADIIGDIGASEAHLGRFEPAVAHLRQAEALYERLYGRTHRDLAVVVMTLGAVHRQVGKFAEAELFYQDARAIYGRAFGEKDYEYSVPLIGLARLRVDQGRLEEAVDFYQQGLTLRRQASHGENWRISAVEAELGRTMIRLGRLPEAEELLVRGYNAILAQYGPRSYMLEPPLRGLVTVYQGLSRDDDTRAAEAALADPALRRPWSVPAR